jgi:hypothetical protein
VTSGGRGSLAPHHEPAPNQRHADWSKQSFALRSNSGHPSFGTIHVSPCWYVSSADAEADTSTTPPFPLASAWTPPDADGSGTFAARSRWLFMTLEDGSGVIAAVTAPEEQFDEELETVLESVTLP